MYKSLKQYAPYLALITIVVLYVFSKTYDAKIDMNGDNCYYYIFSKSLVTGHGYANLSAPGNPPSSTFPPGYPLIMAPFMLLNDSFAFQNGLGYLFLWGTCILTFVLLVRNHFNKLFALFVSIAIALNMLLLSFTTMTMSEMPFAFFTLLFLYCLDKYMQATSMTSAGHVRFWLWCCIAIAVFSYYIRVQGIILFISFAALLMFRKEWKHLVFAGAGFSLIFGLWYWRNKALGLSANRYVDQILTRNSKEPGEGLLPVGELPGRVLRQLGGLIENPLPTSVLNFFSTDPKQTYLLPGLLCLILVLIGCWTIKKLRVWMLGFILGNFALISIWSAPSGNRYLCCFIPVLLIAFFLGLHTSLRWLWLKLDMDKQVKKKPGVTVQAVLWLIPIAVLFWWSKDGISLLSAKAQSPYSAPMQNLQQVATHAVQKMPENAIFCIRKPELFYVLSDRKSVSYINTPNGDSLIRDLYDKKVDYIVLDNLGFSSTRDILFPALKAHYQLFPSVYITRQPVFVLLKFERAKTVFRDNKVVVMP